MDQSTVWDIVQKTLIDNGIDTYSVGQHKGDCLKPYTVLKPDGSMQISGCSSEYHFYTLMCYVPYRKTRMLDEFVTKCKSIMDMIPVYPMLLPTGTETPEFIDDTNHAAMISIQYRNAVRNEHIN